MRRQHRVMKEYQQHARVHVCLGPFARAINADNASTCTTHCHACVRVRVRDARSPCIRGVHLTLLLMLLLARCSPTAAGVAASTHSLLLLLLEEVEQRAGCICCRCPALKHVVVC